MQKSSFRNSMEVLGVMSNSSTFFLDMIKDIDFDKSTRKFYCKKINGHIHSGHVLHFPSQKYRL